jgi:cellulose synthase/poly-beta-1,6-N-acetylglucosamine synthase-like glycosyltransferase
MIETVFWIAAVTVVYTWAGYPLLLALARRHAPATTGRRRLPRLSVLISAYNEAGCIAAKLRSTLTQRYPWDRLEVVVVSDGSTDATDAIVAHYPDPRVRLLRQETRSGKSLALNRAVAVSHGRCSTSAPTSARCSPGCASACASTSRPRRAEVSSSRRAAATRTSWRSTRSW